MWIQRRAFLKWLGAGAALAAAPSWLRAAAGEGPARAGRPNIVYILADDLGYGDVRCLNPGGKIPTPHLDRLAAQGVIFTEAHSGSAVCTPTRYGILTGRYSWRSSLRSGVLGGDSPPLIAPGRLTAPALLKQHGYATGCIGKWHLGMDFARGSGDAKGSRRFDYAKPIANGPTARGFDYYFGISASLDMPPFAFIENDRFTAALDTEKQWIRKGPAARDFEAVDVLPALARKAVEYIESGAPQARAGTPLFLYLALASPHTPIVPAAEWQGKSGLNPYGDFVMQTDAAVGEVMKALDRAGLADNTLLVFTSDNGCSPAAKVQELEGKGHYPSYHFRGYKADIWEGGHHVPFLARWPGRIRPGSRSDQLTCLTDLMATCADLLGVKLPDDAGEDSVSMLPALLGTAAGPLREAAVHHSISGKFSIRQGRWKLELCPGSGGWSSPKDPEALAQGLPPVQLYDMAGDVGEKVNVHAKNPEVASRLLALLEKYVADGRSTPGAPQKNDGPVDIWKKGADKAAKKGKAKKSDRAMGDESSVTRETGGRPGAAGQGTRRAE